MSNALTQMEQAPDWKSRASNHRMNAYRFLRERGSVGVLASELYNRPDEFGRSPRNRLSELARMGCVFLDAVKTNGKSLGHWENGEYRYVMIPPYPETFKSLPDYYAKKEIPWDKRERVKTDNQGRPLPPEDLPLFGESGVRP